MPGPSLTRLFTLASAALLAGCYGYTPAPVEDIRAGMTIRARVAEEPARELARLAGRSDPVAVVEGEVRGRAPDRVVLWWTVGTRDVGARRESLGQRVELPTEGIRTVEVRELDRTRTGVAAGAAAVGLGVLVAQFFGDDTGRSPDPRAPGPEEIRIPLPWR